MKAIIWKELRENAKWALIAAVILAVAELQGLNQSANGNDYYFYDGISLCKKSFLLVTTFGCAAVGIMLGLVQILPEQNRDRWAGLLHRPASRGIILGGKMIAGVILYFAATLPAFFICAWLVATPGNYAIPFMPKMMLPGLADILTGPAYYFAALTLSLQRGSWIGLRIVPILAAIHLSFFVLDADYFHTAVAAAFAMAVALIVAAWGAIYSPDAFARRTWMARAAFLIVIFYGACGLGDLGKALLTAVGPKNDPGWQSYRMIKDGTPILLSYVDGAIVSVRDLQGNAITDPKLAPDRIRNQLVYPSSVSSFIGDSHGWKPQAYQRTYRDSASYLWSSSPYWEPSMEQWFTFVGQRSMIGYSLASKDAVSRFDANGFQPPSAAPIAFPKDLLVESFTSSGLLLSNDSKVRLVSLARREIIDLPVSGPIYGADSVATSSTSDRTFVAAIAGASAISIYGTNANLIATFPYRYDTDQWGAISIRPIENNRYIIQYSPSRWIERDTRMKMSSHVDIVNLAAEVEKSYTIPADPPRPRSTPLAHTLGQRFLSPVYFVGELTYQKIGAMFGSKRLANLLARQLDSDWSRTRTNAIWMASLSLSMAFITFIIARRKQMPAGRAIAWTGFVLALNLAGFITFLLVPDWPRLVTCFSCHKKRVIDAESCPHCRADWPIPACVGTEIFAPHPSTAA